ncbi:hypothetical protein B0H11DRAFT_1931017 [Mycena galericulata]|nr:hypothetical protein B0H11DRAFT_1931017 [Mycena galericulata]
MFARRFKLGCTRTPDYATKCLIPIPTNLGKFSRYPCVKSRQICPKLGVGLWQIPTKTMRRGQKFFRNQPSEVNLGQKFRESDKFDRFWGLGLCQSRQIWPKSTNFRPDKWVSVGTGIWWHNPGSSLMYACTRIMSDCRDLETGERGPRGYARRGKVPAKGTPGTGCVQNLLGELRMHVFHTYINVVVMSFLEVLI